MQRHASRSVAGAVPTFRARLAAATLLLFASAFCLQDAFAQASTIPSGAAYWCDFENSYCDFQEQSKLTASGGHRSSIVPFATSGNTGVRLHTESGDNSVSGSGTWERNDLRKPADPSYCREGQEEWWAFSIMFPTDYVFPPGPEAGIVMDFHHTGSTGQANYEIQTIPNIGLRARGYGGSTVNGGKYEAIIPDPYGAVANVTKNVWYNFVLHVRWSSNGSGLMEGWLNGRKFQAYQGATLYSGMSCYLKLANYHAPFGQASSVIFDRVVRGGTATAVTLTALEGVAGTGGSTPSSPTPTSPTTYTLSAITTGSGTGTVVSSPAGINCGSSCTSTFAAGSTVTLSASAGNKSGFSGWSGACTGTGACAVVMNGSKSVTATFASSSSSTPPAGGTSIPRLANLSTRGQVLTGNDVMIAGFVIGGSASKTVVVRARGPSLVAAGVANALSNPTLRLVRSSDQATLAANDNWGGAANAAQISTSGFAPSDPLESALLVSLPPGAYTAIASGVSGATGVGIIEVFEIDRPDAPLTNISTRGQVLSGNDVLIGGFVIQGSSPQTVVIRARGPSLVSFGIANALANPSLQLVRSADHVTIAANDNWSSAANAAQISTSGFAPSNALESAILVTLNPGAYTAIVTGSGGTGVGIVEVFAVP